MCFDNPFWRCSGIIYINKEYGFLDWDLFGIRWIIREFRNK
jgi:hypothetical protein